MLSIPTPTPPKHSEIHFNVLMNEESVLSQSAQWTKQPPSHLPVTPRPSLTEFDPQKPLSTVIDTVCTPEPARNAENSPTAMTLNMNLNVEVFEQKSAEKSIDTATVTVTPMESHSVDLEEPSKGSMKLHKSSGSISTRPTSVAMNAADHDMSPKTEQFEL